MIEELYTASIRSSNLRCETRDGTPIRHIDVVTAFGMSRSSMGLALLRLHTEWDGSEIRARARGCRCAGCPGHSRPRDRTWPRPGSRSWNVQRRGLLGPSWQYRDHHPSAACRPRVTDSIIHLRVPAATKARWVRESRAAGMRLTDWIVERVEMQHRVFDVTLYWHEGGSVFLGTVQALTADAAQEKEIEEGDK